MAEIIENGAMHQTETKKYASRATGNAGLTLGIIGTALSGLTILGGGASLLNGWGGNSTNKGNGGDNAGITKEELHLERQAAATELANQKAAMNRYLSITEQFYQNKIEGNKALTDAFFDAYQRDVDNSFQLYKMNRDTKDEVLAKQNASDAALAAKIAEVDKKVDIMAAIRPYQDQLIMESQKYNTLMTDYKIDKKTCRMIEGTLVLPSGTANPFCPPYLPYNNPYGPFFPPMPPLPPIDPSNGF